MSDFVTVVSTGITITTGTLDRLLSVYSDLVSNPEVTNLVKDEANKKITFDYTHTDTIVP